MYIYMIKPCCVLLIIITILRYKLWLLELDAWYRKPLQQPQPPTHARSLVSMAAVSCRSLGGLHIHIYIYIYTRGHVNVTGHRGLLTHRQQDDCMCLYSTVHQIKMRYNTDLRHQKHNLIFNSFKQRHMSSYSAPV